MTSNVQPTNYKMKMEYKEIKVEVSGDRKFVEEKFYQLVTAVNKLARNGREARATLAGSPVADEEIFPRPVEEIPAMLDAGVDGEDGADAGARGSARKVERLPEDPSNESLQYIYDKDPGSQVDTVLTMAMYLEQERKLEEINVRDIHDHYRQTHDSVPKNLSVSLQQNVNKGFLARTGNRKDGVRYNLTEEGVEYVNNGYTTS